jgi:hypothetical protein
MSRLCYRTLWYVHNMPVAKWFSIFHNLYITWQFMNLLASHGFTSSNIYLSSTSNIHWRAQPAQPSVLGQRRPWPARSGRRGEPMQLPRKVQNRRRWSVVLPNKAWPALVVRRIQSGDVWRYQSKRRSGSCGRIVWMLYAGLVLLEVEQAACKKSRLSWAFQLDRE